MPKHLKHEFIGESQGNALAEWLNQKQDSAERKKVVDLIEAIRRLDAVQERDVRAAFDDAITHAKEEGRQSITFGSSLPVSQEYLRVLHRVDRMLADCWMRPQINWHGTKFTFTWKYQKRRSEGVHLLIQLMELGVAGSLRLCARQGCDRWLFVTYPTKRYCSSDCQRRDYQTSEEWKRRRRRKYQSKRLRER